MKNTKGLKKYSEAWDDVLNAELEVVKNVYWKDGGWLDAAKYSIKIPNRLTEMKTHRFMDGDQPYFPNKQVEVILSKEGLSPDNGCADYPRHGNTKRVFYNDKVKAYAALYRIRLLDLVDGEETDIHDAEHEGY